MSLSYISNLTLREKSVSKLFFIILDTSANANYWVPKKFSAFSQIIITHNVLRIKNEKILERITACEEDTLNYRYYN